MKKLILASGNAGKLKEINHFLKDTNVTIRAQSEFNVSAVDETGLTFVENAIIKARHASNITSLPTLADDSGLVIEALQGEPGIYSARYAGEHGNDRANLEKVLKKMIHVTHRKAYFYCAMVLLKYAHDPAPLISMGKWEGEILWQAKGEKGFGYDPIFYVPTHQCSAAQLDLTVKNEISHRGQALQQLRQHINEFI